MDIFEAQEILKKAFSHFSRAKVETYLQREQVSVKEFSDPAEILMEILATREKEAEELINKKKTDRLLEEKEKLSGKKQKKNKRHFPSPYFNTAEWVIETCLKFLEKEKIIEGYEQNKTLDQQKVDFLVFFLGKKIPLQVKREKGGVIYHLSSRQGIKIPVICVNFAHGYLREPEIHGAAEKIFHSVSDAREKDCLDVVRYAPYILYIYELVQIFYLNHNNDFSFVETPQ